MQLGGWNGELSCSTIWCQLQKELSITDPNRRIINRKESLITDLSSLYRKKNVHCISRKKLTIQQLIQWETITTLNSHFSPTTSILSKQPLPTSTFYSIKQCLSPLFAGLAYIFLLWFAHLEFSAILQ